MLVLEYFVKKEKKNPSRKDKLKILNSDAEFTKIQMHPLKIKIFNFFFCIMFLINVALSFILENISKINSFVLIVKTYTQLKIFTWILNIKI